MKKIFVLFLTSLILLALAGCHNLPYTSTSSDKNKPIELHIAAAASLTDAMQEVIAAYKQEQPAVNIVCSFGSSGALQQAIENGSQTDLFFSASPQPIDNLEKNAHLAAGTRRDLMENSLVLIVPQDSHTDLNAFTGLSRAELKHIALGKPQSVPVGQYAAEVLTNLGIREQVSEKAVYGSDVRQVLAWVAAGEADCGIVYATDAATVPDVRIAARVPESLHSPIIYSAAVMKDTRHLEEATAFLAFASSEQSRRIFTKYGFICK